MKKPLKKVLIKKSTYSNKKYKTTITIVKDMPVTQHEDFFLQNEECGAI